jgi:L1 cell adhesion molecule like protein
MADIALGSVGKIVEIALKIKEAVETVKQNEKECRDLQRCVARVSALLRKLDEMTETMKDGICIFFLFFMFLYSNVFA